MCISCGTRRNKRDLIRLVLDARGSVVRDDNQNMNGRGAYVCPLRSCLEELKKDRRLLRAFSERIPKTIHEQDIFEKEKSALIESLAAEAS